MKISIPGFKFKHQEDAYGTHQPVLFEAITRTGGAILELGAGFNSTPLIHTIASHRPIWTLDHDEEWLMRFFGYSSHTHQFKKVSWDNPEVFHDLGGPFSVVFIDQGLWQSRADALKHFKWLTELVVLHDSDYLEREGLIKYDEHYKFIKTYMPLQPYPYMTGPPTTLMSNFIDITNWEIDYGNYQ